ncbi:hypothetical protein PHYSODRAFT_307326 [Phytophthora sojae]|uniref:Uncharacterized protein n=1 Tax=Phytophthora sojae (strain P6497) TaxID=1094619 RepID=G5ADX8_PHYSP|nr:hypothetical protein PHYSODRAFT_307326 [Phytophthora sojae]EGZ06380.1 hypothetical protein PHYSODRAFT_307326 [Phytophthora sojae]|eukprot:XP_009538277.1 hypothetical protein PHYSODRAFT_307326 [Phytophthora sojae]
MPNRFTWHYMTFLRYFYERPGQRTFVVGADLAFMIPANTPRAFTTQHLNATEKPREWNLSSLSYQAGNPEMNAAMLTSHRIKTTPTDRLEISVVQQLFVELIEDQEGMRWCSDVEWIASGCVTGTDGSIGAVVLSEEVKNLRLSDYFTSDLA